MVFWSFSLVQLCCTSSFLLYIFLPQCILVFFLFSWFWSSSLQTMNFDAILQFPSTVYITFNARLPFTESHGKIVLQTTMDGPHMTKWGRTNLIFSQIILSYYFSDQYCNQKSRYSRLANLYCFRMNIIVPTCVFIGICQGREFGRVCSYWRCYCLALKFHGAETTTPHNFMFSLW